jgi:hypothetical protein
MQSKTNAMFQLQWQKLYGDGERDGKLGNQRQQKEKGTKNRRMGKRDGGGCYDIMPYPSSPLYLESFSRRDMSGTREAGPEQKGNCCSSCF